MSYCENCNKEGISTTIIIECGINDNGYNEMWKNEINICYDCIKSYNNFESFEDLIEFYGGR